VAPWRSLQNPRLAAAYHCAQGSPFARRARRGDAPGTTHHDSRRRGLLGVSATPAGACTTSLLQHGDEVVVAKSYDFPVGDGLIIVNPRGVAKHAMGGGAYGSPLSWVSRFAA